jgi:hypothetical protein
MVTPVGYGTSTPVSQSSVSVSDGEATATNPFGITLGSISGYVYQILNLSSPGWSPTAPGVSDVTLTITGTIDTGEKFNVSAGTFSETVLTDKNGFFQVTDLLAGNYTITELKTQRELINFYNGSNNNNTLGPISLSGGQNSSGNDFGEVPPVDPFGYVFVDRNNNGVFDPTEKGIPHVQVTVSGINAISGQPLTAADINFGHDDNLDGDNNPFTRVTDSTGRWAFEVLPPGTYTITETQPSSYFDGKEQNGDPLQPPPTSGDNTTSKGVVTSSFFQGIVETPGQVRGPFNFGELLPGTISGITFRDTNNDGVRESGEGLAPGLVVTLTGTDDLGNKVVKTAVTNGAGGFQFTHLRPSDSAGYTLTLKVPTGAKASKTSGPTGSFTVGSISHIFVVPGQNLVNFELGILVPTSSGSKRDLLV